MNSTTPDTPITTKNVFISYHQKDAQSLAEQLRFELQEEFNKKHAGGLEYQVKVFIFTHTSLAGPMKEETLQEVDKCDVFLLIFSSGVETSDMCVKEWKQAIEGGKKIIPILYHRTADDIKRHDLLGLHRIHELLYTDFSDFDKHDTNFKSLVNQIEDALKNPLAPIDDIPVLGSYYEPKGSDALPKLLKFVLDPQARPTAINVTGRKGAGKSGLVLELVKNYAIRSRFIDGICWIDFNETRQPRAWWEAIKKTFALSIAPTSYKKTDLVQYVRTHMRAKRGLIILDNFRWNAKNIAFLNTFKYLGLECRIIITSQETNERGQPIDLSIKRYDLKPLTATAALEYLKHLLGIPKFSPDVDNIIYKIAEKWNEPYALWLISQIILSKPEDAVGDIHTWQDVLNELNKTSHTEPIHDPIRLRVNQLDAREQELITKLVVFDDFQSIPLEAFSILWQKNVDETRHYLTAFKNHGLLIQTAESAYRLHSPFANYLVAFHQAQDLCNLHLTLLTQYVGSISNLPNVIGKLDIYLKKRLFYHLFKSEQFDIMHQLLVEGKEWAEMRFELSQFSEFEADLELTQRAFDNQVDVQTALALASYHIKEDLDGITDDDLIISVIKDDLGNKHLFDPWIQKALKRQDPKRKLEGVMKIYDVLGASHITNEILGTLYNIAIIENPDYARDVVKICLEKGDYQRILDIIQELEQDILFLQGDLTRARKEEKAEKEALIYKTQTTLVDIQIQLGMTDFDKATFFARLKTIPDMDGGKVLQILANIYNEVSLEDIYPICISIDDMGYYIQAVELIVAHFSPSDLKKWVMPEVNDIADVYKRIYMSVHLAQRFNHRSHEIQKLGEIFNQADDQIQGNKLYLRIEDLHELYPTIKALQELGSINNRTKIIEMLDFVTQRLDSLALSDIPTANQLYQKLLEGYIQVGEFEKGLQIADKIGKTDTELHLRCLVSLYKHTPEGEREQFYADHIEGAVLVKPNLRKRLAYFLYRSDKDEGMRMLANYQIKNIPPETRFAPLNVISHLLNYLLVQGKDTQVEGILDILIDDIRTTNNNTQDPLSIAPEIEIADRLIKLAIAGHHAFIDSFIRRRITTLKLPHLADDVIEKIGRLNSLTTETELEELQKQTKSLFTMNSKMERSLKRALTFAIATRWYEKDKPEKALETLELLAEFNSDVYYHTLELAKQHLESNNDLASKIISHLMEKKHHHHVKDANNMKADYDEQNEAQQAGWKEVLTYCQQKNNIRDFIITLINHHPAFGDESYATITKIIKMMTWADGMKNSLWDKINTVLNP